MLEFTSPVNSARLRKILAPGPVHVPYGIAPDVHLRKVLGTVDDLVRRRVVIAHDGPLIYFVCDPLGVAWVGRTAHLNGRMRAHLYNGTSLGKALRRDPSALDWKVTAASPGDLASFVAENLRALLPVDYPHARQVLAALDRPSCWASAIDIEFLCIAITNPFLNRLGRRFKWTIDRDAASRALLDEFIRRSRG